MEAPGGRFSEYGIVYDRTAVLESGITEDSSLFPVNCPAQNVLDIDVDPLEAVVIITLREVLAAIRYFGIEPNESAVVFGCGPVGQTFIKFMHLLGIGPIFALDIIDEKLVSAKANGADYVFNSNNPDYNDEIRKVCPKGVDYVFDAVGVSAIINDAMQLIKDRGKICCYWYLGKFRYEIGLVESGLQLAIDFSADAKKG